MLEPLEQPPLCICGQPRKWSGHYIQETESEFYKTCGNLNCRKRPVPLRVGVKQKKLSLRTKSDPTKICKREGCGKMIGKQNSGTPKRYCSRECARIIAKQGIHRQIEINAIKLEQKRKFLTDVFNDLKAGVPKHEIRRKYFLDIQSVDEVIYMAITNKEREVKDKLRVLEKE